MDLIKELEKMEKGNLYPHSILDEINAEKAEIDKKAYVFKVLSIAKDIEDYVSLRNFSLANIGSFELDCSEDEYNKEVSIAFAFNRCNGEFIPHDEMTKKHPEILQRFREIFNGKNLRGLKDLTVNVSYLDKDFIDSGADIELVEGVGEELIKSLLSKELRAILDYSKMQLSLDSKEESGKKLKV